MSLTGRTATVPDVAEFERRLVNLAARTPTTAEQFFLDAVDLADTLGLNDLDLELVTVWRAPSHGDITCRETL